MQDKVVIVTGGGTGIGRAAATFHQKKPFGKNVDWRSHCGDMSYVAEHLVQNDA